MIPEDDEILQDFLVEAGEILELLGEQLVELEQNPEDADLLNAVFRGFHTVKGGAGFLNIVPMIDVCHRAEDVFNVLRQGERKVDPDLMDSVLTVLDILNEQFQQISEGEEPISAEPELLSRLEAYAKPQGQGEPEPAAVASEPAPEPEPVEAAPAAEVEAAQSSEISDKEKTVPANSDDITDEEFESLLDALESDGNAPYLGAQAEDKKASEPVKAEAGPDSGNEDITEEEFEALLDELHGSGKHASASDEKPAVETRASEPAAAVPPATEPVANKAAGASDENITDDEFEDLLDQLHGQGKIDTSDMKEKKDKKIENKAKQNKEESNSKEAAVAASLKQATKAAEPTVRVDTKRLDDIMNMVGELVLVRNRLDTLKTKLNDEDISKAVGNLDIVTSDLQAAVMKTRMQPIKKVFGRFPRVVRDLARNLSKEVNLELMGEETDLDKNLVEALADPMVHLVRNSVDHGIEMPDDREQKGKKRSGTIVLSAAQEGDHILLTIEDDGAGMDANVLRRKAIEKGVLDEDSAARLDDREAYNLIFSPGFSTKAEISDISGRGVGMDVVKTRISQLNGTIDIESELGKGTRISIKLPLTLAILPTLMVKVGVRTFALPLSSVNEIFSLDTYNTNTVDGQLVIMVRNKAMPLYYLYKWLAGGKTQKDTDETDQVVVANVGNQRVGFVVSQVVGQEEVVIKPLGALLHGLPGFAGATITGDGRIALILDIPSLMRARATRL
jgi:two-component system chemotaxis sensor kinase CheA